LAALPVLLLFELFASLYLHPCPETSNRRAFQDTHLALRLSLSSVIMAAETNNQGNAGETLEKDFSNGTRYPSH
jgi:hypothetical protein